MKGLENVEVAPIVSKMVVSHWFVFFFFLF